MPKQQRGNDNNFNLNDLHQEIQHIITNLDRLLIHTKTIESKLREEIKSRNDIKVGDKVRSTTEPYHDGIVTRFSKNRDFVFIRTGSGKEEFKAPRYVQLDPRQ